MSGWAIRSDRYDPLVFAYYFECQFFAWSSYFYQFFWVQVLTCYYLSPLLLPPLFPHFWSCYLSPISLLSLSRETTCNNKKSDIVIAIRSHYLHFALGTAFSVCKYSALEWVLNILALCICMRIQRTNSKSAKRESAKGVCILPLRRDSWDWNITKQSTIC